MYTAVFSKSANKSSKVKPAAKNWVNYKKNGRGGLHTGYVVSNRYVHGIKAKIKDNLN